jgi:hypothetical protein
MPDLISASLRERFARAPVCANRPQTLKAAGTRPAAGILSIDLVLAARVSRRGSLAIQADQANHGPFGQVTHLVNDVDEGLGDIRVASLQEIEVLEDQDQGSTLFLG